MSLKFESAKAQQFQFNQRTLKAISRVKRDVFIVKRESMTEDRIIRKIARALRELCSDSI